MIIHAAPSLTIKSLEERIAPLREQLSKHPLYASLRTLDDLRIFMESHVFAVWDFMCLLKSLQRSLTSVDILWVPTHYPASRRFINEIVLGEESDEYDGRAVSHFEIYIESMTKAGADTSSISSLLVAIRDDPDALDASLIAAPSAARHFVLNTLNIVMHGSLAAQAAAFTFGREDAIPDMFRAIVRDLNVQSAGDLKQFVWYLERHIEVDEEDHGPLSLQMVADLCGSNPAAWEEAALAADNALRARLSLWDGIQAKIEHR